MSHRPVRVLVAAAALVLLSGVPAAADPPTVLRTDPPPRLDTVASPACGFDVVLDIEVVRRTFVTHDPSPVLSRQTFHVSGTVTGPTGRSVSVRTVNHITVRETRDGVVEVQNGHVLPLSGRRVFDPATRELLSLVGHPRPPEELCAAVAP